MKINLSFVLSFLLLFMIFTACSNQQSATENLAKEESIVKKEVPQTSENIEKNEELEQEISNEIENNFNENVELIDNELVSSETNTNDASEINSYFSEIESDFSDNVIIEDLPLI